MYCTENIKKRNMENKIKILGSLSGVLIPVLIIDGVNASDEGHVSYYDANNIQKIQNIHKDEYYE